MGSLVFLVLIVVSELQEVVGLERSQSVIDTPHQINELTLHSGDRQR